MEVIDKIIHVDCGLCKRFETECKPKGYLKHNYMPECKRCVPFAPKVRKYDNTNKRPYELNHNRAIMSMRPSAKQGHGHK